MSISSSELSEQAIESIGIHIGDDMQAWNVAASFPVRHFVQCATAQLGPAGAEDNHLGKAFPVMSGNP